MGWPMNSRKYFDEGPCSFFYNKLLFEIEIIKFLKKNKFYVIYKSHPERKFGIKQIYGKYVDEIVFDKFENAEIYNKADALIFTHTSSSVFGYSLCTNKKIILLYNENYMTNHLKSLKKRLLLVKCNFNKKYIYNNNKILNFLKKKKNKFNFDYVKNYLL